MFLTLDSSVTAEILAPGFTAIEIKTLPLLSVFTGVFFQIFGELMKMLVFASCPYFLRMKIKQTEKLVAAILLQS